MANIDCLGGTTQGSDAGIKRPADARSTPVDSMWKTRNGDFGDDIVACRRLP